MADAKPSLADRIRDVPETAVRLHLGAQTARDGDGRVSIELDGRLYGVPEAVYEDARAIARALAVRPREVRYATDVLELRHRAEELFLESLSSVGALPKVLFLPAGDSGSSWYRARIPMGIIYDRGLALADWTAALDISKALRYDVLWVQLAANPVIADISRLAQNEGVKIVYDVDDRFDAIPGDNPAAALYVESQVAGVWAMVETADLVTVSTTPLADHVRARARAVRVVPNMVPAAIWPRRRPPGPATFRILWAGSPTHRRDLALVVPALAEFLGRLCGKARLTLFGENLLEGLVPVAESVDLKPFVAFEDWAQALSDVGADVVVAPLMDDEFNRSKSAIRVLESGACGYPIMCSPVGEYAEVARCGAPVRLVPDGEWGHALNHAFAMRALLRDEGARLREWTLANRCILKSEVAPWMEAIRCLVPQKS